VMVTDRVDEPITSNRMTSWLVGQMVVNAQSAVVAEIRANWTSGESINRVAAMQAWTALVGTDATWDFKVDIRRTAWFARAGIRDVVLGGKVLNWDAVANMHFGYVGRAAGFDSEFLGASAGIAQVMHWLESQDPDDIGAFDRTSYGDHPFATWSIRFGCFLWDLGLEWLDDAAFANALAEYIAIYGEPPDPPPGSVEP
jgi:hypothetical protein